MSKTFHYSGDLDQNQVLVADLGPAKAKEFWRIMHSIASTFKTKKFNITNSRMQQAVANRVCVDLDLTGILGEDVSLYFTADVSKLSLLKTASGESDQVVIHDTVRGNYLIKDASSADTIKGVEGLPTNPCPHIEALTAIGSPINVEDASTLKKRFSKSKSVSLNIYDNQLEKISDSSQEYVFSSLTFQHLQGKHPDSVYNSQYFAKFGSKRNMKFTLAKDDNSIWMITDFEINLSVKGKLFELL